MKNRNIIKRIHRKSVSLLPYMSLVKRYNCSRKEQNESYKYIEELLSQRFFDESPVVKDYEAVVDRANNDNKWCIIEKVIYNHQFVNVCFISEVLSLIIWCLENGYKPLIDVRHSRKKEENLWGRMFKQPFDGDLAEIRQSGNYIVCPFNSYIWPQMKDARNPERVDFWHKMYNQFVRYNDECQKYLNEEYEEIIKGKRVLGSLVRGIEYDIIKAKDHPIQPLIEELIEKINEVLIKDNLDYIYLATDDQTVFNKVKEAFGEIVLENKREYYDKRLRSGDYHQQPITYDREDGAFLKALEYLSSVNLVSKCDSFVGGLCGGSEAAEYFNGNQYKTNYLFDRGVY